jgi:alkaline phosphatase D
MNKSRATHPASIVIDRRQFVASSTTVALGGLLAPHAIADQTAARDTHGTRQAMGTKVGEVSDCAAIVWARLTAEDTPNSTGRMIAGRIRRVSNPPLLEDVDQLAGACPGAAGRVRLRYGASPDLTDARVTDWVKVSSASDFSHQFELSKLKPSTTYHYATETSDPTGKETRAPFLGQFETAPSADETVDFSFCVITCLKYADLDPGDEDGFKIFPAMQKLSPKFVAFTGDNVYYDNDAPQAVTPELARYHWQRMYGLRRHVELLRNCATYWQKDDHDTQTDDCWPGRAPSGKLSFQEGQKIFRQQVPLSGPGYRTYRWGKWLQIWLTEVRDFRSPNNLPDGPEKTIWGREQKEWLYRTLLESDARWKVLISPTPIVGPDRSRKNDNHSNLGFVHEGNEFRHWVRDHLPNNFFVVGGDRHWQYHSVHPESGMHEFGCGPVSDRHASGSPGFDAEYHRFHELQGGFLSVAIKDGRIIFRHHNVRGETVYEWRPRRD